VHQRYGCTFSCVDLFDVERNSSIFLASASAFRRPFAFTQSTVPSRAPSTLFDRTHRWGKAFGSYEIR